MVSLLDANRRNYETSCFTIKTNAHFPNPIRLKNYDYSQAGFYFITICTQNRVHLFGDIVNGEMVLNDAGVMMSKIWHEIPYYYHKFAIHEFVIMPNHIHGIIEIVHNAAVGDAPTAYYRIGNPAGFDSLYAKIGNQNDIKTS